MASNTQPLHAKGESDDGALAVPGFLVGLIMLIAAFATLDRMPDWADDYGAILVYLAFFLYMSIAGRLTWWGLDTFYARLKQGRSGR
ncbi:hypothetical protein ACIBCN_28585 [Nocardia sp. NPDC051052]|uniref:hypothetical protein n=1 Tax=Nocardia sp. NPDC051052 TaxID=3364322 RepID=UPI0037A2607A